MRSLAPGTKLGEQSLFVLRTIGHSKLEKAFADSVTRDRGYALRGEAEDTRTLAAI